jgi:integrase
LELRDTQFALRAELFIKRDGTVPTRAWFLQRLHVFFGREVSGHSLRSGGATALALAGASDGTIQRWGRWSSQAFQIYIRKHPLLVFIELGRRAAATSH